MYLFICFHVSPADLFHLFPHPHLKSLQSLDIFFPICPCFSCIESYTPYYSFNDSFLYVFIKTFLDNSFLSLKAFLAIPILVLISVSHLPSLVMRAPRYLNRSTCSSLSPSIVMFILPSPFLDPFMTFVLFMFTFMSSSFAVRLSPSVSFCRPPSDAGVIPWSSANRTPLTSSLRP